MNRRNSASEPKNRTGGEKPPEPAGEEVCSAGRVPNCAFLKTGTNHNLDRLFRVCLAGFAVVLAAGCAYAAFLLRFAAEGSRLEITLAGLALLEGALGLPYLAYKLVRQGAVPLRKSSHFEP